MQRPQPKSGARDSSDADELLASNASVSTKSRASIQARRNGAAASAHRAHFARQATIDAFEWRYAKTLDQADFIDRPPTRVQRSAAAPLSALDRWGST